MYDVAKDRSANADRFRQRPPVWVSLEGVHNMRDIGGYATADDAVVHTGLVYRSDTLERATDRDILHLKSLGIRKIVDLRTIAESAESMGRYHLAHDPEISYICLPTIPEGAMSSRAFPVGDPDAIGDLYLENLLDCRESVTRVLRLLASTDTPVILHCAAGRDRTGAIVALLLDHLGVSDEQIALDYTASSSRIRLLNDELSKNPLYQESRVTSPDELTAEPQTIYRFLDDIRMEFGGASRLIAVLAGRECAALLRTRLLSPAAAPR